MDTGHFDDKTWDGKHWIETDPETGEQRPYAGNYWQRMGRLDRSLLVLIALTLAFYVLGATTDIGWVSVGAFTVAAVAGLAAFALFAVLVFRALRK